MPLEANVVRRVLVKDGDSVQAGQVLVELDPTIANAEKLSVQEQLNASQSEVVRTAALLQRLAPSAQPTVQPSAQPSTQSTANATILLNKELLKQTGQGLQADLMPKNGQNGPASYFSRLSGLSTLGLDHSAIQAQLQSECMDIL